jgi:hypothetical protein
MRHRLWCVMASGRRQCTGREERTQGEKPDRDASSKYSYMLKDSFTPYLDPALLIGSDAGISMESPLGLGSAFFLLFCIVVASLCLKVIQHAL